MILAPLAAALLTQTPAAPPPAPPAEPHDMMMMHEGDHSIPGDSPLFKDVNLKIVSPKEGEVVAGPDMDIAFQLTGYKLAGSQPGPHIHVIIDNQPYQPDYDASKPFKVTGLSPGPHTLRAFPSRPWHESIKAPHAFAMTHFFVGEKSKDKNLANWIDPKKPILTFSRPKGAYMGDDAKKVMVDFYLTGAKLSPSGNKVKLVVDGKESLLTQWASTYLEDLANGPHQISLDLLDKKGAPIANTFNHTERTFTINPAPLEVHPPAQAPNVPAPQPAPAGQPAPAPAPAPAPTH